MEQQHINCPKKGKHTVPKWTNTISKRRTTFSARTTRRGALLMTPSICTASLSRKRKTYLSSGFDTRSRMDRRICMCEYSMLQMKCGTMQMLKTCRIVGKGNHSVNHVQKIKPRVEQVCQELGLQYATEENAGRMYINLQGGPAVMPPANHQGQQHHGGQQQHGGYHGGQQQQQPHAGQQQGGYAGQQQPYAGQQQGGYPGQQQQQQGGQQNNDNEELEKLAKKILPKVLRKLEGCCTVM
jgi:hypothetical protein